MQIVWRLRERDLEYHVTLPSSACYLRLGWGFFPISHWWQGHLCLLLCLPSLVVCLAFGSANALESAGSMKRGRQVTRGFQGYMSCLKAADSIAVCLRTVRFPVEAAATFIKDFLNTEGLSTYPARYFSKAFLNSPSTAARKTERSVDPGAEVGRWQWTRMDSPGYIWKECGHISAVHHLHCKDFRVTYRLLILFFFFQKVSIWELLVRFWNSFLLM